MKSWHFIFIIVVFYNTGCNNRTHNSDFVNPINHVLDFDKALKSTSEIMLSSVASELEFISLETNDSLLLDEYLGTNVESGHILVWSDETEPVLFDRKGRFVSRIGRYGKGPKEIIPDAVWDMSSFIDGKAGTVALNAYGKQYTYTLNGTLLSVRNIAANLKKILTDSVRISITDTGLNFFSNGSCFLSLLKGIVYTSTDGGTIFRKNEREEPIATETGIVKDYVVVMRYPSANVLKDNVAFFDYETGSYNRFFYDGTSTTPYVFKFKEGFKVLNGESFVRHLRETPLYLFINISNQHRFIYDKQNDELTAITPWPEEDIDEDEDEEADYKGRGYLVNDIEPAFEFRISGVTAEGDLYDLMSAVRFRAEAEQCNNPKLKRMAEKMNDDDNQVIVIAKMKK